jgi:diguanylate cyclase (GGDEF)-like protein/PAS domain S-box-containing protein
MTNDHSPDIYDYLKWLERSPGILKRALEAIAIYDLEGRVVYGNAAARQLIGEEFAALLQGQHFTAHLTLEGATKAARDFAHCVTLGEAVDTDMVFRDGEGQPVPLRMRMVPAVLDGTIVGVIGFARDGRGRRSVEEQFIRSEQQFRSLFENHPDALALHDLDGRFTRVNAAVERITGFSVEELVGQTPAMLAPEGWPHGARIRDAMLRGETIEFEHTITTKAGAVREIDGRAVPLHVDGRVRGFCGMIRDVTDERRAARTSARQATRIAELYRIAANASVPADEKIANALEAGMTELGSAWACVMRADDGEITCTSGLPPAGAGELIRPILNTDTVVAAGSFAGAPLAVEGERYGVVAFALETGAMNVPATDRDYMRALAALIASAIQQNDREKRLDSLAFGDSLTGLPNRALLQDRLEQTLLSARRHRRSFASHYIDIDHFKQINDTYGHHVGDAVLIAVSAWLRAKLRDSDTIGRIGGDEFVVLQPEIDSQRQAEELASKLCTIRDEPFHIGSREIMVTISVGCAVFPVDAENPVDMLRAADKALYDVKHRGRDGYAIGVVP